MLHSLICPGRRNQYDGVLEYWVTVRETGQHMASLMEDEIHRTRTSASCLRSLYTRSNYVCMPTACSALLNSRKVPGLAI